MTRLKYDYIMLKSICDEGGVRLLEDYSDKYITRDTRIIAKCIMCENSFNKSFHFPSISYNIDCFKNGISNKRCVQQLLILATMLSERWFTIEIL